MSARFIWSANSREARTYKIVGWTLFVIALVLFTFAYADTAQIEIFGNGYALSLPRASKAIAFMIAILGLQVVVGYTGQLVLGQSFFFGTGAYLGAYMVADHNWPWVLSLLVVVPVCFIIGAIFGLPALRIKGLYLALVTLGLAATFPSIVQLDALDEYTGGASGKTVSSDLVPPSWLPLDGISSIFQNIPFFGQYFGEGDLSSSESERIWKFFLFTVLLAICIWLVSNLIKSRSGRALRAIRDNETSAAVSGVNLAKDKTLSFGLASALGGVGGVVYVAELGIASPLDFTQLLAINFIVGLVVGGVGTLSGAVVGGIVIAFIPDWSASTESFPGIPERWLQGPTGVFILGALLILLTFVLPGGVVAGMRRIKGRILQIVPQPPKGARVPTPPDGADAELRHEADEITAGVAANDPLTDEPKD
ncbi:branched-chain amino acid ABC transporter permease [Ilumatobacter nonamiensis]|uniref:branched-chain amino acid ABC transporter permease n=1 Tax=Ilumatobacter nonamiensis TaxID=467093 RepID=UPI00034C4E67|nr:branched-chain amino acid ABC transporter permease [Ilumatobacter nonamiensis]